MKNKNKKQIADLKIGGKLLSEVLDKVRRAVKPGITTGELDALAENIIRQAGARPSFKGFQNYPATLCTSVNEELVHGLPGKRVLKEGDVVGLDCGLWYKNLCTDMALTVPVGLVEKVSLEIIEVTKESLRVGLAEIKPGNTLGDYGWAVQQYVEAHGFSVIRGLVGHGVGFAVHEEPQVPNFGQPHTGLELTSGMVLALEPMVSMGGYEIMTGSDGWTISMQDGSRSAHFEVTIVVTERGWEYITPPVW